jgi:hypothetical protein
LAELHQRRLSQARSLMFLTFGSLALVYCHVSKDSRKKLEPTTEKGILWATSETSKAYRVYIPSLRKTVISVM